MTKSSFLLLLALFLLSSSPLLADREVGYQGSRERMSDGRQCRLQQLSAIRPSRRIESDGGVTELWDQNEDQLQCAGVAAMRDTVQPQSMSLPKFLPTPHLLYIQRGQGVVGISYPGCPESFHSGGQRSPRGTGGRQPWEQEGEGEQQSSRDQHQRIHRIRQGDIVAIPPGVAHWCYNDGNEDLVAFSVMDLNHQNNQLDDQSLRGFHLAGGQSRQQSMFPGQGQEGSQSDGQNILRGFDTEMFAQALNIPVDLARRVQQEDQRGFIVRVQRGEMGMIKPEEEQGERREGRRDAGNGLEETLCTMKVFQNLDNQREAVVVSRQAGRLNSVNMNTLPILRFLGMSAEKGTLRRNAIFVPHWSMNSHNIILVTRGEGHLQVVNNQGRKVFDDKVREGELIVVPQFFACMKRGESDGFEWVNFKTSALPMTSPVAGHASVFKGMPLHVLANSYRISISQAADLKNNRERHMMLFPPSITSTTSS